MQTSRRPTRSQLIEAVQRIAGEDPTISRRTFVQASGYRSSDIERHFENWTACAEAAGKQVPRPPRYHDSTLFEEAYRVLDNDLACVEPNRFSRASKLSRSPFARFGTWEDTLDRFVEWAQLTHPDWNKLDELSAQVADYREAIAQLGLAAPTTFDGPFWGEPLHDPVFQFAPTDESGVVALFGAWAEQLGFRIGRIGVAFPDCFAWERTRHRQRVLWQQRHIEFEYQSKNFRDHGHDPSACDLIVCWEHNWLPDAPVRVLALKDHASTRATDTGHGRG